MIYPTYTLDFDEIAFGTKIAGQVIERVQTGNIANRPENPQMRDHVEVTTFGTLAELAWCLYACLDWYQCSMDHRHDGDCQFGIEVKARDKSYYDMLVNKGDITKLAGLQRPFVYVNTHRHPTYEMRGWLWSSEIECDRFDGEKNRTKHKKLLASAAKRPATSFRIAAAYCRQALWRKMNDGTECPICNGERWVCENHPSQPWLGGNAKCCGGAGAPCNCSPMYRLNILATAFAKWLAEDGMQWTKAPADGDYDEHTLKAMRATWAAAQARPFNETAAIKAGNALYSHLIRVGRPKDSPDPHSSREWYFAQGAKWQAGQ